MGKGDEATDTDKISSYTLETTGGGEGLGMSLAIFLLDTAVLKEFTDTQLLYTLWQQCSKQSYTKRATQLRSFHLLYE